jgi:DNA-binding MarR family transcriptional regulator
MNTAKPHQLVPLIIADIYELAGAFREHGETIAQTIGQTQARWQVLSAASAGRQTVPQIARRLGVTRQAVQRLANELVHDRLATFTANPEHQSSPHLVLTKDGTAALAQLSKAGGAFHSRVAAALSASDLRHLHHGLRRLIGALDALPDATTSSTKE